VEIIGKVRGDLPLTFTAREQVGWSNWTWPE